MTIAALLLSLHTKTQMNHVPYQGAVPGVQEVSIGHALVADALELGYAATIRAYLESMTQSEIAQKRSA